MQSGGTNSFRGARKDTSKYRTQHIHRPVPYHDRTPYQHVNQLQHQQQENLGGMDACLEAPPAHTHRRRVCQRINPQKMWSVCRCRPPNHSSTKPFLIVEQLRCRDFSFILPPFPMSSMGYTDVPGIRHRRTLVGLLCVARALTQSRVASFATPPCHSGVPSRLTLPGLSPQLIHIRHGPPAEKRFILAVQILSSTVSMDGVAKGMSPPRHYDVSSR